MRRARRLAATVLIAAFLAGGLGACEWVRLQVSGGSSSDTDVGIGVEF